MTVKTNMSSSQKSMNTCSCEHDGSCCVCVCFRRSCHFCTCCISVWSLDVCWWHRHTACWVVSHGGSLVLWYKSMWTHWPLTLPQPIRRWDRSYGIKDVCCHQSSHSVCVCVCFRCCVWRVCVREDQQRWREWVINWNNERRCGDNNAKISTHTTNTPSASFSTQYR